MKKAERVAQDGAQNREPGQQALEGVAGGGEDGVGGRINYGITEMVWTARRRHPAL